MPITLTFTVLHMLVSLVQYSCHRCDEDDNDDEPGSINQGLLRLATPPRQAGPPINRDMCYQVFRFKSWKWRSAVIGILCGMFVFSLSPLMPASLPPAPLPPAPLPPAPAQGACYHVNCGHGICHALSSTPSPSPAPTPILRDTLNSGLLIFVIALNLCLPIMFCHYPKMCNDDDWLQGELHYPNVDKCEFPYVFLFFVLFGLQIWGSVELVSHNPSIPVPNSKLNGGLLAGVIILNI